MDTFMQVLITIVIGIASLLVVTMTKHHHKKVVVFITIFISAVILIITWRIACPVIPVEIFPEDYSTAESKDTDVIETDLAQYLGHPMSEILNVVPDHKLEKNDDDEIKYSAPNMSITGKNQNYLTRIYLSGTESEYSVDGILLGMAHDEAVKELDKKGYIKKDDLSGNGWEVYRLKKTYIGMHFSDQWIDEMYCSVVGYFITVNQ